METFRFLLFGFAGVSVVFWVATIALWHAYMFPRFFNEDKGLNSVINQEIKVSTDPILGSLVNSNNFSNRDKYSMKSLVIADFSSASNNFKLNLILFQLDIIWDLSINFSWRNLQSMMTCFQLQFFQDHVLI